MRAGLILAACLIGACAKQEPAKQGDDKAPPPMVKSEQERGRELCDKYVERLCACAETDAALKSDCELARSQPQALAMHYEVMGGSEGPLNERERRYTESAARKIVAACVKSDAALDPAKCPRR